MGPRAVATGLLLAVAAPAFAGTGANFTLGIGIEYLSNFQTLDDRRWGESTLQPVVSLGFDGNLVDPRFLVFGGQIAASGFRFDQTDVDTTTQSQLNYGLDMRLFSNRAVSVELAARRIDSNVSGPPVSGLTGGVDQSWAAVLDVRPTGWPQVKVSQTVRNFTADERAALRDQETDITALTGSYNRGIFSGDLLLRREKDDYYNSLIKQNFDLGTLSIELGRAGRDSFLSQLYVNRFSSETGGGDASPVTTSYTWRNRYRHLIGDRGSAEVSYNQQISQFGGSESIRTGQPAASLVLPLNPLLQAEAGVSYLFSDLGDGRTLRQPLAGLGVRFGRDFGLWNVSFNPFLSYVSVSGSGVQSESSWGGQVYAALRANFPVWTAALEGQYMRNQLSIGTPEPGLPPSAPSFLAGLDRDAWFVRLSFLVRPSRPVTFSGTGQFNRRTRLTPAGDVSEEFSWAQADLTVGPVRLTGATNFAETVGGEAPASTRTGIVALYINLTYWLQIDGASQRETREILGVSGQYRLDSAGLRLRYGRLSVYARYQQETFGQGGSSDRKVSRIWAGASRDFDFSVGQVGR